MAAIHSGPGDAADHEKLAARPSAAAPSVAFAAATPHEDRREDVQTSEDDGLTYPKGFVLVSLTLGMMGVVLMVALDNYILATAIPRITTQFNSLDDVAWYASSYFLTQMAFQPMFGQLYSSFSIKAVYIGAVAVFELGSILCATATSSVMLIVGRLISGAGGGGLYVGTLTLMGHAVPIQKRPAYIALVTSMFGAASVAGPLLGGVFTNSQRLTWRFCFWINLPIGFVTFILIMAFYKTSSRSAPSEKSLKVKLAKMDVVGVCLLISGFMCLLLALQWAGVTYSWSNSKVWGCLLGFFLIVSLFILLQVYKGDQASIPLRLISQRTVAASSAFMLSIQIVVGVLIYYLPFYFQAVQGVSPEESGIRNLPFLMTSLFSPIISGFAVSAIGYYVPFMWIGSILATVGSGLLFSLKVDSPSGVNIGYQVLAGLGAGMCNQLPFTAVQYILPQDKMIQGSAMVSFCNSLGPVLGISVAQAVFATTLAQQLQHVAGVNPAEIIHAGPTNLRATVPAELLAQVLDAFDSALTKAFCVPVFGGGLAFCSSLAMEWGNIRRRDNRLSRQEATA